MNQLRTRHPLSLILLLAMSILTSTLIFNGDSIAYAEDEAVESGRKALENTEDYPWYNSESDSIRRVREGKKKKTEPPQPSSSRSSSSGGAASGVFGGVVWFVVIGGILALIVVLIWAFMNRDSEPAKITKQEKVELQERIDQLPLEIDPSKHDLYTAARQEYQQGNYSQAIIYLFSFELIELDKKQLIRLLKGKTNRQYLLELRSFNNLSNILAETIRYFEDAFFGKYEITKAQFETCWNQVDQFKHLLNQSHP